VCVCLCGHIYIYIYIYIYIKFCRAIFLFDICYGYYAVSGIGVVPFVGHVR